MQGVPKEVLLHEFESIPLGGYGPAPDFLDADCFPDDGAVPYLGNAPSDFFYTLGTAVSGTDENQNDMGRASSP